MAVAAAIAAAFASLTQDPLAYAFLPGVGL